MGVSAFYLRSPYVKAEYDVPSLLIQPPSTLKCSHIHSGKRASTIWQNSATWGSSSGGRFGSFFDHILLTVELLMWRCNRHTADHLGLCIDHRKNFKGDGSCAVPMYHWNSQLSWSVNYRSLRRSEPGREQKISFSPGRSLSPAHLDCADYTDIGTRERIAIYVVAIIYHWLTSPLHRTSCDEDRSFHVRFSRYVRRTRVSQYRKESQSDPFLSTSISTSVSLPSFTLGKMSFWLSSACVKVSIYNIMFRRQRKNKNASKLTWTWTPERVVRL